ncbi:MAG: lysophospholipid acyltransferase family protein [bacterium]|nr:lysophospholipid acyltransferase family protein [bacterium]
MPSKLKQRLVDLLIFLGPWLIRLICFTLRIRKVNFEPTLRLIQDRKSILYCLWHGRMFVPIFLHRRQGVVVMISRHADGEMIARIVTRLGYRTVRGSSKKGGREAFYDLLAHLKAGDCGCMLPDGPTGPRHYFKPGTLLLAQQSDAHFVATTFAARSCWRFKSWDKFVLPKPFARCVVVYSDPIEVPQVLSDEDAEDWRLKLETLMIDQVAQAEREIGGTGADV